MTGRTRTKPRKPTPGSERKQKARKKGVTKNHADVGKLFEFWQRKQAGTCKDGHKRIGIACGGVCEKTVADYFNRFSSESANASAAEGHDNLRSPPQTQKASVRGGRRRRSGVNHINAAKRRQYTNKSAIHTIRTFVVDGHGVIWFLDTIHLVRSTKKDKSKDDDDEESKVMYGRLKVCKKQKQKQAEGEKQDEWVHTTCYITAAIGLVDGVVKRLWYVHPEGSPFTAEEFLKFATKKLLPAVEASGGRARVHMDQAAQHTAASTNAWFAAHSKLMYRAKHPPQSPDLNPIERVFNHLMDGGMPANQKNFEVVGEALEERWNNIDDDYIRRVMYELPAMMALVHNYPNSIHM